MNRRQALLFTGLFLVLGVVAGLLWLWRSPASPEANPTGPDPQSEHAAPSGSFVLYFPGADGRLHEEVRGLDTTAEGAELVERLVTSLLSGPDNPELFAPLPLSTTVGSTFLGLDGTLYLDLASAEHPAPPVAGSQREILAVYSLVNSICNNVPGIRGVVLLWNSEQRTTFAGNLDTTRPLLPNRRLVSSDS